MSLLAEQNVIGALMIDAESITEICDKLRPEMFTNEVLSAVYAEYLKGFNENYEVNLVVLNERVDQRISRDTLNQEMLDCSNATATSVGIESYAQVVIDDYIASQVNAIMQRTVPTGADIDEQLSELIASLESLQNSEEDGKDYLIDLIDEKEDAYFLDNMKPKIKIGFSQLDEMLGGFDGGDMVVIGARPAVGKSALVTQIAVNLASQGLKIGFFSLEMQKDQMYERFIGAESGLGVKRIRRGLEFQGDEENQYRSANNRLREIGNNIAILTGTKSMSEIRARCRKEKFNLVIIDYLQLLKPESQYRGNRYAEVGAISHAIKNLAMELDIPIIALSQMNRVSEQRDTKEPTMSELRESGDVEQDASTIILLWNKDENDKGLKGCKIEKQRQGITGSVTLRFDGDKMHFEELPKDDLPFEY